MATDADVHVKTAKALTNAEYGTRNSNAFVITSGGSTTSGNQTRNYEVSIKTGNKTGAGTDSNIYLTLSGVLGRTEEIQVNQFISGNAFERNNTDTFMLKNIINIGEVLRSVKIRSDDKFAGSAWYLESITINGKTVKIDKWIQTGSLEVVVPFN
jgi:hypothetical protein